MKAVTIIVAIINDDLEQVRNCLTSIDRNRFEVIIVCPTNYHASINEIFNEFVSFKIKTTENKPAYVLGSIEKMKLENFSHEITLHDGIDKMLD